MNKKIVKIEKDDNENSQKRVRKFFIDNNNYLTQLGYYEKNIIRDGYCYYKFLSFNFRGTKYNI